MAKSGYDISFLFREAQTRWLKAAEVLFILQNHEKYRLTQEPPQKPTSGSLYLFNRRVLRFFRKDGHSWRKKKDGRTVGEAHERLKVGNVETLNCYYAHGEQNPSFQRRCYWMLDPANEHIVLVHYREINEAKLSSASNAQSPVYSSAFTPCRNTSENPGSNSLASDAHEPYQNLFSPGSFEACSDKVIKNNGIDNNVEYTSPADLQVSQALKRIEEQSCLNDSFKEMSSFCGLDGDINDSTLLEYGRKIAMQDPQANLQYKPDDIVQDRLYSACSDKVIKNNGIDNNVEYTSPADLQVSQALKRIEEQSSLNDSFKEMSSFCGLDGDINDQVLKRIEEQSSLIGSFKEMSSFCGLDGDINDSTLLEYGRKIAMQDPQANLLYKPDDIVQDRLYSACSDKVIKNNGIDNNVEYSSPADLQVSQALKRIEEQSSLNEDSFKEMSSFCGLDGDINDSTLLEYGRKIAKQDPQANLQYKPDDIVRDHLYSQSAGVENYSNCFVLLPDGGENGGHSQVYDNDISDGCKKSQYWKNVFDSCKTQSGVDSQGKPQSSLRTGPAEQQEQFCWLNFNGSIIEDSSVLLPQEVENVEIPSYSSAMDAIDYYTMLFKQDEVGIPFAGDSSLTIAQKQKFTIREISPGWGYSSEPTKVIIVGSFLCDPSESGWACMFGETEIPLEIIQEGVICCKAPPHLPGKVTLCITSGNRESCSEIREFEYRVDTSSYAQCSLSHTEAPKSPEEVLLLVRFAQMLLSDCSLQKGSIESGIHFPQKFKADDDSWSHCIEALLIGSGTSSGTVDWLLQELLKDKLQQWLCSRSKESGYQSGCTMSKKEQGIIHMAAGLGFDWALNPILKYGVSINFRDINGLTALHWAARFGREKMVAALIASGASAGAVTDPTSQDPNGKTAASIAASRGHKGLAGYLSELALTSHLSSLTLEESEFSKDSAAVQAEMAVKSVSKGSLASSEYHHSLKDVLAAVRNATMAAARIQNAFRAHSFRKRQQKKDAATAASVDEYGISSDEIQGLSTMSKLAFGNGHDLAALSIQKKFRGWKGRRDFLALRRKVVKIQAHIRGYQVRKYYKLFCWAVGVLDKVVLRWRRKGVGLRGFRSEQDSIDDSEDEDILKVFRKQKVGVAIDGSISYVLSMVKSPDARQQYCRMLERYRQAKDETVDTNQSAASTSVSDNYDMESDDLFHFP